MSEQVAPFTIALCLKGGMSADRDGCRKESRVTRDL